MKLLRAGLLSVLLFGGALSVLATDFSGWSKAMPVTFSGYGKPETLTNFPVLVTLSASLPGFSYADFASPANGADLRFSADNQTNELAYEIEKWDTNGVSSVWVKVPALAGTNTQIWALWGNPGASVPAYSTNGLTWDASEIGVWHMAQASALDSTTNRFHGSASGTVTQVSSGMIAGADEFDADLDWVQVPDSARFTLSAAYTVSAWIRPDPLTNDMQAILGSFVSGNNGFIFTISTNADNRLLFWAAGFWRTNLVGISDGVWSHVAYTRNGTTGRFYVNGTLTTSITNAVSGGDGGVLQIGAGGSGYPTQRFDGRLDEVRLTGAERSSNWMWAAWLNTASNAAFGAAGNAGDFTLSLQALSAGPVGVTNATLNGKMLKYGGAGDVYFCWDYADKGTASTGAWEHVEYAGNSFTNGQPFAVAVNGLLSGSTYVYRCYATNLAETAWSGTQSFTLVYLPVVTNTGADVLSFNTARLKGTVTDTGTQTPSVWFLYWIEGSDSTNAIGIGPTNGACSVSVSGLLVESNYVFMVMASNAAGIAYSGTNGFLSAGRTYYVVTNGNNAADGLSWATAVSNVEIAVQRAAAVTGSVLLGDGNFAVTSSWIQVTNAISVSSLNGSATTSLDGGNVNLRRIMYVNHPLAKVSGLTLKRGSFSAWSAPNGPGALQLAAGLVSNCIVTANSAYYFGGVYMTGGTLVDCLIHNNTASASGNGRGGGLGFDQGDVINCIISNNIVSYDGGGVFMTGGRMRDCQIVRNNSGAQDGGGVNMSGGTLERCVIKDNNLGAFLRGGGVYMSGGNLVNSVVANNASISQGGGIFMAASAARVIHTTVTGNRTASSGHGIHLAGGAVSNTLVIGNGTAYQSMGENVAMAGGTFSYSATAPLLPGPNNVTVEPRFANAAAGDYRLLPGSPCIDVAAVIPGITNALGGTARSLDGNGDGFAAPDMGAYESSPAAALACAIDAPTNEALLQLNAVLTAVVAGPDTNIVWYGWDIDNDGNWDYQGVAQSSVSHSFGVGFHTVTLAVSNTSLESATCTMPNFIRVAPLTNYVARTGFNANLAPYDTWQKAASNIEDGVDAAWAMPGASPVVLVSNGTYAVSRTVRPMAGLTVQSLNGPASTIVNAGSTTFGVRRAAYLDSADAVLSGFTLRGGSIGVYAYGGAGLWLGNGLVTNCIITLNASYALGTGVYMNGGRLADTTIYGNTCGALTGAGGALNMSGGTAERCVVRNNSNQRYAGSGLIISGGLFTHGVIASNAPSNPGTTLTGGGILISGGNLRNSLVVLNGHAALVNGGGIVISGGAIESCTIVSNRAAMGGGLAISGGTVSNTIVALNVATNWVDILGPQAKCAYSCSPDLTNGVNNNVAATPLFKNRLAGDYRLALGSAGINQGLKQDWMTGALDLAGESRLVGAVDMGAYESRYASGTVIVIR